MRAPLWPVLQLRTSRLLGRHLRSSNDYYEEMDLALASHSHSRPKPHHQQSGKSSLLQPRNSKVWRYREGGQGCWDRYAGNMQSEWAGDLVRDQLRSLSGTQRAQGHSLGNKHKIHSAHSLLARSCRASRWKVSYAIERGAQIRGKLHSDKHRDRRQSLPVHFFLIVTLLNKKDNHFSPRTTLSFFTSLAWELY